MFLLVQAYPGCPGSKAVKRSLYDVVVAVTVAVVVVINTACSVHAVANAGLCCVVCVCYIIICGMTTVSRIAGWSKGFQVTFIIIE